METLTAAQKRYKRIQYYVRQYYSALINKHRNQFLMGIDAQEHQEFQQETGLYSRRIEVDPTRDSVLIPTSMAVSAKESKDYP